jgi:hypothetical protein
MVKTASPSVLSTSVLAMPPLLNSVNAMRPPYDKMSRPGREPQTIGLVAFDRSGFYRILSQPARTAKATPAR